MNVSAIRLFPVALIAAWVTILGSIFLMPHVVDLHDRGDFLIRNTVRLALVYWAIAVALMLRCYPSRTRSKVQSRQPRFASFSDSRIAWTLACATYLVHVAVAFEHAHHWSHAEAFEHVKQAGGVGEGIYVSYFFTLLWLLDAAWWWIDRGSYEQRPRAIGWIIHGFMVFMIVNGAIIFEDGPIRWIGATVLFGLAWLFWIRMEARRQAANG